MNDFYDDDFSTKNFKDSGFYENCTVTYDKEHQFLSIKNSWGNKCFLIKTEEEKQILQDHNTHMAISTLLAIFLAEMFPFFILGCFSLRDLTFTLGNCGIMILIFASFVVCGLFWLVPLTSALVSVLNLEKAYEKGQLWKFVLPTLVILIAALVLVFQN